MKRIHKHSIAAYRQYVESGKRLTRCMQIIELMLISPAKTDREIKEALNLPDMNCVRPRITELIDDHVLEECDKTHDSLTNTFVRMVRIKQESFINETEKTCYT